MPNKVREEEILRERERVLACKITKALPGDYQSARRVIELVTGMMEVPGAFQRASCISSASSNLDNVVTISKGIKPASPS